LKRRTCFVLVLILFLLGSFAASLERNALLLFSALLSQSITEESGSLWLYTSGTKIFNAANQEVVFNGASTATIVGWEPAIYPPPGYDESSIDVLRSHGLNLIRLDIGMNGAVYGIPASQQTPTTITFNQGFFPYIDRLVNECAKVGVWVNICFVMNQMSPLVGWGAQYEGGGAGFPTWMYNGSWSYFNKIYRADGYGLSDAIRDFWNINDTTAANVRTAYQTWWKVVADHYKDSPNVIFGLWNEPQGGGTDTIWGGTTWAGKVMPSQEQGAAMYKIFVEETVDIIRSVAPNNLIFVNDAYFLLWVTNPKIDRPNIVVENHAYNAINLYTDPWGNNPTKDVDYFINLGWRYNQPFILGEFGGIEEGNLQDKAGTLNNIQYCNSKGVSWSYLSFRPSNNGWNPSADTWELLESNLVQGILYFAYRGNDTQDVTPTPKPTPTVAPAPPPTATRAQTAVPASSTPTPNPSQTHSPSDPPTASPEPTITPTGFLPQEAFYALATIGIISIITISIVTFKKQKK
jgi:hypothetical protein